MVEENTLGPQIDIERKENWPEPLREAFELMLLGYTMKWMNENYYAGKKYGWLSLKRPGQSSLGTEVPTGLREET